MFQCRLQPENPIPVVVGASGAVNVHLVEQIGIPVQDSGKIGRHPPAHCTVKNKALLITVIVVYQRIRGVEFVFGVTDVGRNIHAVYVAQVDAYSHAGLQPGNVGFHAGVILNFLGGVEFRMDFQLSPHPAMPGLGVENQFFPLILGERILNKQIAALQIGNHLKNICGGKRIA